MELSEKYLDDLMVRMAHHSTAIEGNTLTLGETKSILIDGYVPRPMNMRELYEVVNYKAFIPFLTANIGMRTPLSLNLIKSVHAILCKDAIESVPGDFKRIPNQIIGANFTPTPPYLVPSALQDWILNLEAQLQHSDNNNLKVEAICRQHIAFEHIHPFPDGNGRVGRALMVYTCLFMDMPPIVIPVNRKGEYISYLNTEDIRGFTDFALQLQNDESARMRFEFTG
ncbi:MAG: Fic family protein [Selenomonadaceae bacterium]|nr:Fic family protein [Selenomonadaceae bacterium]